MGRDCGAKHDDYVRAVRESELDLRARYTADLELRPADVGRAWLASLADVESSFLEALRELLDGDEAELYAYIGKVCGLDAAAAKAACSDLARMEASRGSWVPLLIEDPGMHRAVAVAKVAEHLGNAEPLCTALARQLEAWLNRAR